MKSKRIMATGRLWQVSCSRSQPTRNWAASIAFLCAPSKAASSLDQCAMQSSCDIFLNAPGLLFPGPQAVYSKCPGCNRTAGVQSRGGKKNRRNSKSKSTHSCTMQQSPSHPSRCETCVRHAWSSDSLCQNQTCFASQDQPSFTTPLLTGLVTPLLPSAVCHPLAIEAPPVEEKAVPLRTSVSAWRAFVAADLGPRLISALDRSTAPGKSDRGS
mmetsp:Transcript_11229/g.25145  ORF Transcript_11229/g.25145 Transcript_11229/m.25145 type:complete len:214 (+) Transcript_11229:122-763(+)